MAKQKGDVAEESFLELARTVIGQLQKWAKTSGVPQYHDVKIVFRDHGTNEVVAERPHFWRLLAQHDQSHEWIVSASAPCIKTHLDQGLVKTPNLSDANGKPIADPPLDLITKQLWSNFFQPILDVIEQANSLRVRKTALRDSYRLYRTLWSTSSSRMIYTVPIVNLDSEVSFRISQTLELRPFLNDEKTEYFARIGGYHSYVTSLEEFRQSRFKLGGTFYNNDAEGPGFGKLMYEVTTFMTAMRLLKRGMIGASLLSYQQDYPLNLPMGGTVLNGLSIPKFQMLRYSLSASEVDPLLVIFRNLLDYPSSKLKKLQVALRRFNQSYSRQSAEDRIIDLTIALESCLLAGTKAAEEIAYKFSLRGSAIIANLKDPAESHAIFRYIYSLRSAIVHEGKMLFDENKKFDPPSLTGIPILRRDIPDLCEEYTRLVLKEYMAKLLEGNTIEKVNEGLDQKVIAALRSVRLSMPE
jgi:hypothetical protein